jgi:hypothetical protein
MDFSHMNLGMIGLVGAGLVTSFWLVFKIAWKVVKIGFFAMAFLLGFAICAGLSTLSGHPQPVWALGAEALAFAWGFSLVRSKIAKVITGLAILTCAQFIGKFGFDVHKLGELGKVPLPFEQSAQKPAPKPAPKPEHKPASTSTAAHSKKPLTPDQKKAALKKAAAMKAAAKRAAAKKAAAKKAADAAKAQSANP